MTILDKTLPILICNFPILISARHEVCLVYPSDDPSIIIDHVGVHYCNPANQKCCKTGCCITSNAEHNFLWLLVLVFIVAFAYWMRRYCKQYCNRSETRASEASRGHSIFDEEPEVRESPGENSYRRPTIDINVVTHHPHGSSTVNSHPITPPPSYDVAVLAPPDPPTRPEDRIPSYEDVIKGKLK